MMVGCHRAQRLLAQRAAGLSIPERLRLEDHLQRCPRCTADGIALSRLAALADFDPPGLRGRTRDRVIERAIRDGSQKVDAPPARLHWRLALAGTATVAVAAAALMVTRAGAPTERAAPAPDRILAGTLTDQAGDHHAGAPVAPGIELVATTAGELALGHARIAVAPDTRFSWRPDSATLTVHSGAVRATVDPGPRRRFRIATDQFTAMVVGTELEVTPDRVRVFSGEVAVFAPSGEVLARRLRAGQTWHRVEMVAATPEPAPTPAEPAAPPHHHPAATPSRHAEPPATDTVLAAARSHLAGGEIAAAEKLIAEAAATATRPRQRAEAATLHAEVALVAGDHDQAVGRYLEVAERYRDLGAGENALFAAARIEANRGHYERARELLERYLERYPKGRFRAEAERRLER